MYNDDDFNEEEEESSSQNQNQNKILEFYEANKKLVWILGGVIIFIIVFSLLLGGNNNNNKQNNEITVVIDKLNEKISIGNSVKLYANIVNNPNAVITWTSSDPSIAKVDPNTGVVTGVNYGTAIITSTYIHTDNKPYYAKCEVVVKEGDPNLLITSVEFPEGDLMMSLGSDYKLSPIIAPKEGYITNLKYTSYNKEVAEVSTDGIVKAKKTGEASVVLKVNDGKFEEEIKVIVIEDSIIPQIVVNPTSINFTEKLKQVEINDTVQLKYDYEPYNTTLSILKWESSDPSIATVENGMIKGVSVGTTEITVTALNGKTAIMTVKVEPENIPVSSITLLSESYVTLSVGGIHTIVTNIIPADASDKTLTFTSSNPSVATVDNSGQIKAISTGSARITVTTNDGNKTVTVNVTVQGSSSSSGGSSSGGSSSGGSTSIGTIKYRDKNNNPAYATIEKAKAVNNGNGYVLPITVSVNYEPVDSVKLCVKKCATDSTCPDISCVEKDFVLGSALEFTEGDGLYVIRATKYTNDGRYSATSPNYVYVKGVASSGDNGSSSGDNTVEVTSISVPDGSYNVAINGTLTITPTILPSNADKKINCAIDTSYSGQGAVDVSVSPDGTSCLIKGKTAGNVRIKITSKNSNISALKVVTVVENGSTETPGSSNDTETENQLTVNWDFEQRYWTLAHGNVNEGYVGISSSSKKISDVYACIQFVSDKGCASLEQVKKLNIASISPIRDYNTLNGAYAFVAGLEKSTYRFDISDSFSYTMHIVAYEEHEMVITVKYTDGTFEQKSVKTIHTGGGGSRF